MTAIKIRYLILTLILFTAGNSALSADPLSEAWAAEGRDGFLLFKGKHACTCLASSMTSASVGASNAIPDTHPVL